MHKLALVLGGGGAAGMGHVPVLQGLDDAGLRPALVVGTSIGALVGAIYAAGVSGEAIGAHFRSLGRRPLRALARVCARGGMGLNRGLPALNARRFAELILPPGVPERFEDLPTPLRIVATDYRTRQAICLQSGDLRSAIGASIAIPGVFKAVAREDRLLLDGGLVANLPLAHVPPVDRVLAVNVFTDPPLRARRRPGNLRAVGSALRMMICAQAQADLAAHPPDLLLEPPFQPGGPGAIWRIGKMLEDAAPLRAQTRDWLAEL